MKINLNGVLDYSPISFGYTVEIALVQAFQCQGFMAYQVNNGHDLEVTNLKTGQCWKIEVKASRPTKENRFHATLIKNDRYGSTNAYKSDFIVFVTVDKKKIISYIIPTKEISSKQIKVPNNKSYNGKWLKYRNQWGLIS